MRILNFGSINIDYVYRVDQFVKPGETKTCQSLTINAGGKGLNQSIAAARAGNTVLHAGLIGSDGQFLADVAGDDLRPDHEPAGDIGDRRQCVGIAID